MNNEEYKNRIINKINALKEFVKYLEGIPDIFQSQKITPEELGIEDINYEDDMIDKLNKIIKIYEDFIMHFEKEFPRYNEPYKKYFLERYNNIENFILEGKKIYTLNSLLDNLKKTLNESVDDLFSKFKYGDMNYIIFGKNGAGKSSLARKISNVIFNQNSFVIPANRSLKISSKSYEVYEYKNEKNLNKIFEQSETIPILIEKVISKKLSQLDEEHKTRNHNTKIISDDLYEIFSKLNLDRNIILAEDNSGILNLYNKEKNIEKYNLMDGSDGEKDIAYLIMTILLLPENAFLFIDEPENHLNGQLMIDLFNELENYRKDIKFVYLTHDINFIESRNNANLIYLEKTDKKDEWKYKEISKLEEIGIDTLLKIEGSKKDVIFCEGNDTTSYDYKIFQCVYEDFLVFPVEDCEHVTNKVRVCNENVTDLRRKFFGIVDYDFRSQQEVDKLEKDKIFVHAFSEIENLLIDPELMKMILRNVYGNDEKFQDVMDCIIEEVEKKMDNILNDYLNKNYEKKVKVAKLKYDNDNNIIIQQIDNLNEVNKKEILSEVENLKNTLQNYLKNKNYEYLVKVVPGKFLLKPLVKKIGFQEESYISAFINQLNTNQAFKNMVKGLLPKIT